MKQCHLGSCPEEVQTIFRVQEEDVGGGLIVTNHCLEGVDLRRQSGDKLRTDIVDQSLEVETAEIRFKIIMRAKLTESDLVWCLFGITDRDETHILSSAAKC